MYNSYYITNMVINMMNVHDYTTGAGPIYWGVPCEGPPTILPDSQSSIAKIVAASAGVLGRCLAAPILVPLLTLLHIIVLIGRIGECVLTCGHPTSDFSDFTAWILNDWEWVFCGSNATNDNNPISNARRFILQ